MYVRQIIQGYFYLLTLSNFVSSLFFIQINIFENSKTAIQCSGVHGVLPESSGARSATEI